MVASYTVNYIPWKSIFKVSKPYQMPDIQTTYRSYLLRLWQSEETGLVWRVMLESVKEPGQRHYFKDLESLTAYLLTKQEHKPPEAEGDE